MAVDTYKNYPHNVLEASYTPKDAEGIVEGMMVKLDANDELVKADGTAGEYAMLAMNGMPKGFMDNSGKIQCIKENGSFLTDQFKVGPSYTPHVRLQVSTAGGEEGLITIHGGGASPVIGRFIGWNKNSANDDVTFMTFDLVRD